MQVFSFVSGDTFYVLGSKFAHRQHWVSTLSLNPQHKAIGSCFQRTKSNIVVSPCMMPQRYTEVNTWPAKKSRKSSNPNIQLFSLAAERDQIRHNRLSCWLLVMKLNRIIVQTCSVAAALRSLIVSSSQLIVVWCSTRWATQGCLQISVCLWTLNL